VGEEDTSKPGLGRVAEFTEDGKLVAVWNDGEKLSAPWGVVFAPKEGFGALSGHLLVANFGDAHDGTSGAVPVAVEMLVAANRGTQHPSRTQCVGSFSGR
jgi:hypothetical protein